ncbi:uncharacterized protein TRAVEDRAFT_122090 [Trametes versicolor FP-101664 SS1]|uniref:uncharacterized protein n=1 Tax=Trametes versicolor (strain FP-101664) TaxID=717944 RepID=UPI00046242BC|nr:uncharacterized protein TRAVEDRAFT_122090 [Trametes versicolor FP-101664 SS1]EIW59581.1 hypothetical protein TRAVEDRAFT_122090 [Trametes versicolor FP-101664 SS1]
MRKYSAEEKEQLLANLDLEVAHKTRQFEDWLSDALENFRRHQEGLILRIPRIVRNVTLRDFAKYNGDIQECVKGLKRDMLGAEDNTIDAGTRKRKWIESQETEDKLDGKLGHTESSRAIKTARTVAATPKKKPSSFAAPTTASKTRLPVTKTPAKTQGRPLGRIPSGAVSPSPQKGTNKSLQFPRTPSRFASPSKPSQTVRPASRVPSSSTFNPTLASEASHPRWPRKNENMLSANGSPLANPYQLDLKNWFNLAVTDGDGADTENDSLPGDTDGSRGLSKLGVPGGNKLKKQRSIVVRSASNTSVASHGGHSRSTSQASTLVASQSSLDTRISGASNSSQLPLASAPSVSALLSVQTKDGHVLEFNPLQTTPDELDALEGITDSAKKQAKEDMARLIQVTMQRWKLS